MLESVATLNILRSETVHEMIDNCAFYKVSLKEFRDYCRTWLIHHPLSNQSQIRRARELHPYWKTFYKSEALAVKNNDVKIRRVERVEKWRVSKLIKFIVLADKKNNKEIAEILGYSVDSVDVYRKKLHIVRKLGYVGNDKVKQMQHTYKFLKSKDKLTQLGDFKCIVIN